MSEDINVNAFSEALNDKMDRDFKNCEYIPVNKAGDTMTGDLIINNSVPALCLTNTEFDITSIVAPSSNLRIGEIRYVDKLNITCGWDNLYHLENNVLARHVGVRRIVNGNAIEANFMVGIDNNGKVKYAPHQLITCYVNGQSGYNIWSNGYCEQWGTAGVPSTSMGVFVSLPKTFKDTNYTVTANQMFNWEDSSFSSGTNFVCAILGYPAVNGFTLKASVGPLGIMWKACGYLASGQY